MLASIALRLISLVCVLVLAACGGGKGGGYYLDDGPPSRPPSDLDSIPDAVPRIEPLASGSNRPYTVMGQYFVPDVSEAPYRKRGVASWYGKKFHGNSTSNGERYDMYAMTAAHTTLPIPSYVRVTKVSDGRSVVVRVNDRGPFLHGRVIDLSYAAAHRLGIVGPGSGEVIVERITPAQIRAGTWQQGSGQTVVTTNPMTIPARETTPGATSGWQTQQTYLQIGAFQEEGNARALASRAAGRVPGQLPVEVDQSDPQYYRVRIGPFVNRQAATEAIDPIYHSLGVMPTISR